MAEPNRNRQTTSRYTGRLLSAYIRFVHRTSRVVPDPPDAVARYLDNGPLIAALWHGQFVMVPAIAPRKDGLITQVMVAKHGDADVLGRVMTEFDMALIRGAGAGERRKNRGGVAALRLALKALARGENVAMTADVPPGPARKAGLGIVTLARMSGRPVVPVAVATDRFIAFDTWSRLTINLPFSKIGLVVGDPIFVPSDATPEQLEASRQLIERAMNKATERAYAAAGGNALRATPPSAIPANAPPPKLGLRLKTYRLLTGLATPVVPLILKYREAQGKEDPKRRKERLGRPQRPRPDGRVIWFHAASVGETNAILPLIDAISAARPDRTILLTTVTRTSAQIVEKRANERLIHQFGPIDSPGAARRFLAHWRPELAVFAESEIWPNQLVECSNRNIPVVLVNARMSKRSYGRWWRWRRAARQLFSRFTLVLAQNEALARRFRSLGARSVRPLGNIKIDAPSLPVDEQSLSRLRGAVGDRPVFLAASTHPGEEDVVFAAHRILAKKIPNLLTILAPRHPHRADEIMQLNAAAALTIAQRSSGALPDKETDVYLADTIGELSLFYRLSDTAFIGGSITDRGGQNPVEAIREDCTVIAGRKTQNFADAYSQLRRAGALTVVETAPEMADVAHRLLTQPLELERTRQAGQQALEQLAGALPQTVLALLELLPETNEDMRRAS